MEEFESVAADKLRFEYREKSENSALLEVGNFGHSTL